MSIPITQSAPNVEDDLDLFKEYLSEPRFRIRLDDLVNKNVHAALLAISNERFPLETGRISGADFKARLLAYEQAITPLQSRVALLGRWASTEQRPVLCRLIAHLCDNCAASASGNTLWGDLRWYPVTVLMYCAGIGALSAENYSALAVVLTKRINPSVRRSGSAAVDLTQATVDAMLDVSNTDVWKRVEEYKQMRLPESDYLLKILHPVLEDALFLGLEYSHVFDRFEILRSLHYADVTDGGWGPLGRFAWKYGGRRMGGNNPFTDLRQEAAQFKDRWGPIQAGLFRGSYARFEHVAAAYEKDLLGKFNLH